MYHTSELEYLVQATESIANIGYWKFEMNSGAIIWSDFVYRIYGFEPGDITPNFITVLQGFKRTEKRRFLRTIKLAIHNGESVDFQSRIVDFKGASRVVKLSALPIKDSNGQVINIVGIAKDVTIETRRINNIQESQRLLETASSIANIGHWHLDLIDNELFWSDEVYRIHGFQPGEVTLTLDFALQAYHPDDRDKVVTAISRTQSTRTPFQFEARIVRPNGEIRYIKSFGEIRDEGGESIAMFGIIRDITEKIEAEEQSQLWTYLVNETPEAIVITDKNGRVEWTNSAFEHLTGYSINELKGIKPGELLQGPDTNLETRQRIGAALSQHKAITEEILNYSKTGDPYWILLSIFPKFNVDGEISQYMAIEIDITDRVKSEQELAKKQKDMERLNFQLNRQRIAAEDLVNKEAQARQQLEQEIEKSQKLQEQLRGLASTDEMTGIANRRYFLKRAETEFKRALRYASHLHIVMFDIDHFKQVNDTYGHPVGDRVIVDVANLVTNALRNDIDFFGRMGGEEFCFLLCSTEKHDAICTVERIRNILEHHSTQDNVSVTCSFGIALANDYTDLEQALMKADEALYKAKNEGRNRVVYCQQ